MTINFSIQNKREHIRSKKKKCVCLNLKNDKEVWRKIWCVLKKKGDYKMLRM